VSIQFYFRFKFHTKILLIPVGTLERSPTFLWQKHFLPLTNIGASTRDCDYGNDTSILGNASGIVDTGTQSAYTRDVSGRSNIVILGTTLSLPTRTRRTRRRLAPPRTRKYPASRLTELAIYDLRIQHDWTPNYPLPLVQDRRFHASLNSFKRQVGWYHVCIDNLPEFQPLPADRLEPARTSLVSGVLYTV
jgi:hypothetical protein